MRFLYIIIISFSLFSCKNPKDNKEHIPENSVIEIIPPTEDTLTIGDIVIKDFREFKVLDSKYIKVVDLWQLFADELKDFSDEVYQSLKPFILDQDIPTLQKHIAEGKLSYEDLTKFYLYRIRKFDRGNKSSLNSVIALNPNVIAEARLKDSLLTELSEKHPIFGMPILLKDNINTSGMPTTAGAVVMQNNKPTDAFIVEKLKQHGALILGKSNLSEWAYFFCGDCPSGYSAIGGQTLNPYGRRILDTGGSSSGSGVAVAANFCAAAIGSETSGSILSPASQNSTVGLKPTIGLLSRSGIVPISSTLDTPGPITKNVLDNAIVLDAMIGYDDSDVKSLDVLLLNGFYFKDILKSTLKGNRFGVFKRLMEDSLYVNAITVLKEQGAEIIEIEEEEIELPDFLRLLNLDMKKDLPEYLKKYPSDSVQVYSVADIIEYNKKDSMRVMPYGQKLFEGIEADLGTNEDLESIKKILHENGKVYFDAPMKNHQLNGILSINNYHAGFAAVAEYPAITVPMGYAENGAPRGLTFIAARLQEKFLLEWAHVFEQVSQQRISPKDYK